MRQLPRARRSFALRVYSGGHRRWTELYLCGRRWRGIFCKKNCPTLMSAIVPLGVRPPPLSSSSALRWDALAVRTARPERDSDPEERGGGAQLRGGAPTDAPLTSETVHTFWFSRFYEIVKDLHDSAGDRRHGVTTTPTVFGERFAMMVGLLVTVIGRTVNKLTELRVTNITL